MLELHQSYTREETVRPGGWQNVISKWKTAISIPEWYQQHLQAAGSEVPLWRAGRGTRNMD